MILSREVDDVVRLDETAQGVDEHAARAHLTGFASSGVLGEVGRPSVLELQGNALAHHADTIHRVDDRVHVVLAEQIALGQLEQNALTSGDLTCQVANV